jgi:hypothetical protein
MEIKMKYNKQINQFLTILFVLLISQTSMAWEFYGEDDDIYIMGAAYNHFSSSDDHEGPPILVSAEIIKKNNWFYGLSLFNNSFGQFSQYAYIGKEFKLDMIFKGLRSKLSAGIIYGYTGEFEDKVPFNYNGFAPAIIPGLGYQKDKWGVDVYLMGNSGLLLGVGYKF